MNHVSEMTLSPPISDSLAAPGSHYFKLLIVEDDLELADAISTYCAKYGAEVRIESSGLLALDYLRDFKADVVLLDLKLPKTDGLQVCRRIRQMHKQLPIVIMTACPDAYEEVIAFEIGADDYIHKPVELRVLVAHLRGALRRTRLLDESSDSSPKVLGLNLSPDFRDAFFDGRRLVLQFAEIELLRVLCENVGRVVDRKELLTKLNLAYSELDDASRAIDSRMSRLRRALADHPNLAKKLKTVRRAGYMIVP
ncbi:MAG: response regulator transcription factor [Burkholderiales bacterium]|nr:response regulator transcription factor [Burkholderiales bacterium]